MGKRKRSRSRDSEKLRKRVKKLERRLLEKEEEEKKRKDKEESPGTPPLATSDPNVADEVEDLTGENIPEELLQSLGEEGEIKNLVGEDIQQQLADRWSNIMLQGLGKDAREKLIKKYHIPANFTAAVPPKMNQEIGATMSDTTKKRDRRIVLRQTLVGKMMIALGRALSSVLKGNLNTKEMVEQINDSAKLAAEVYYQDSYSRKFFALAGTTLTVKEAVKDGKTDEYLFGKNCGEQIKAAQIIKKTSAQIKSKEKNNRQENWKSPLQPAPQYRSGQSHRPPVRGRANQPAQRPQVTQKKPPQSQRTPQSRYRRY